jgi:hypothetical protein
MARLFLVRDRDGAILAEIHSPETALRMFERLPSRGLSLLRLDDNPGEIIGTTSLVSVRSAD